MITKTYMNLKTTYTEWLDYCEAVVNEAETIDQLEEAANNSSYAIYYSQAWDLVCAVREWEPELFDEVNEDATHYLADKPTLLQHISAAAYLMTHHKLEQIWEAR